MTVAGDETHVASDERVDLEWLDLLERGERCSKPRKRSSLQGLPAEDNAAGVVTCFAKVACCISCPMADAEDRLKPLGHLAKDSTSRKETVLQVFGSYAHPRNSTKRDTFRWQLNRVRLQRTAEGAAQWQCTGNGAEALHSAEVLQGNVCGELARVPQLLELAAKCAWRQCKDLSSTCFCAAWQEDCFE